MTPPSPSEPPEPAQPVDRPAPSSRAHRPTSETTRVGIYLTPAEFEQAKAGYLADWQAGGHADTFARWIAAALQTHADRTPDQRADLSTPRPRAAERSGVSRSFTVPTTTVSRLRAAIAADQHTGRWPTVSAWCADAIALAVQTAQHQAGGTLPTPPARLPNRLVRPDSP